MAAAVVAASVPQLSVSVRAEEYTESGEEKAGQQDADKDSQAEDVSTEEGNSEMGTEKDTDDDSDTSVGGTEDEPSQDSDQESGKETDKDEETDQEESGQEEDMTEDGETGENEEEEAADGEEEKEKDEESVDGEEEKEETADGKDKKNEKQTAASENETDGNKAMRFVMKKVDGDWENIIDYSATGFEEYGPTENALEADYQISYDLYIPSDASFNGSYWVKPVLKMGQDWTWTDGDADSGISLTGDMFKVCEESDTLIKYTYTGKLGADVADSGSYIAAIEVLLGSSSVDYEGVMFVDNVSLLDADGEVMAVNDFSDESGAVELGDMEGVELPDDKGEEEQDSAVVYSNDFDSGTEDSEVSELTFGELAEGNLAVRYETDLTGSTGWKDIFKQEINLPEVYTESFDDKLVMEYDIYFPENSIEESTFGTFKAQAALKCNDSWTWISQKSWPAYTTASLEADESTPGYEKFHVSIDMNDFEAYTDSGAEAWGVKDITSVNTVIPCLAGDISRYQGELYLDNLVVTAYHKSDSDDVVRDEDVVLDLTADSWNPIEGYQYDSRPALGNQDIDGKTMLKAAVDYTAKKSTSWSEAKIDYTHPETVDSMAGYNTFKAEIYYNPEKMTQGSFKIKIFCESLGLDKDKELPAGKAVEGIDELKGYYKSELSITYNSKDASFDKLTLGIVGVSTDYEGDIYIGDARFTQVKTDDIYVDSTITERIQSPITVSADGRSIKTAAGKRISIASKAALVDADAISETVQLYAYLQAVGQSDSVIFGHQNDTHKKAGTTGEGFSDSDTEDVTGSIAGVVGIDTLSLTGNEASAWDTPEADRIANLAAITRDAAGKGAIITLSSHMPNFEVIDNRVKAYDALSDKAEAAGSDAVGYWEVNGEKQYNFSGYTPGTLTGDVVSRIMPGGDLNYLFTDYLDLIADYAKSVEGDGVTILFRPFHENTGSWFWWGAAFCDEQAYINLYRYTVDYLKDTKGVHNMLYVYGPGSEAANAEEYAARYPGDAYVDMIGYDMYHSTPTQDNEAVYLANIRSQNNILSEFARAHKKLYAITETGVANNGAALLASGNEVKDWYMQLLNEVKDSGICYLLVWANFNDTDSFYTPFVVEKKEGGVLHGHEMLDDFIAFYNDTHSVFATDMADGFRMIKGVTNTTTAKDIAGYITAPLSGTRILEETAFTAKLTGVQENAADVSFVLTSDIDEVRIVAAYQQESGLWEGLLTQKNLEYLGESAGTVILEVNGKEVSRISVIFNKEAAVVSADTVDDFETYGGSNAQLQSAWAGNKDAGSDVSFELTAEQNKVFGGEYALSMDVYLKSGTAWAGATKTLDADWSQTGDALQFYTIPEAYGQKVVVQLTSAGNVFEVYLQEYDEYIQAAANGEALKVTIPFSQFKPRDTAGAVIDSSDVASVGLWCNAIAESGAGFPLSTAIYYDEMKIVTASDASKVTFEVQGNSSGEDDEEEEDDGIIHIEDIAPQTYTGKAIKPAVVVKDGNRILTLNKDYTVQYQKNTNAGTASVMVRGKGNYSGSYNKNFTIIPKSIADEDMAVSVPSNLVYTGREQKVNITVKYGKITLNAKNNRDYKIEIMQQDKPVQNLKVKEGTYLVRLTGQGNYEGTVERTLKVENKILLSKATVTLPAKKLPYSDSADGARFEEGSIRVTAKVKENGKTITRTIEPAEYEITYVNNHEVGRKAAVVIKAKDESSVCMGEVSQNFEITGNKFNTSTVAVENFVSKKVYTGKEQRQGIVLKDKRTRAVLERDVDYTITYANNIKAGRAAMVLTGIGKYTGTIKKNYTISKAALTKSMIKTKDGLSVQYNKAGAVMSVKLQYNGVTLTEGIDYTLSYGANKAVTDKAYVNVKGKGNFSGTLYKAVYYNITPKSMADNDITVAVEDVKWNARTKVYKPAVSVYDNGKKLKANTDYTVEYTDNKAENIEKTESGAVTDAGHTAKVTVKAKAGSNYTADTSKTVEFRIAGRQIKDAKVAVISQAYDKNGASLRGEAIKEVTYRVSGNNTETLREGTDYEIVSVSKNTKKGNGEIIIKGMGKYCGTKKITFKIGSKSIAQQVAEILNF